MPDSGFTKVNWTGRPLLSGKSCYTLMARCAQSSAVFKVLSCELTKQNPYCVSQVTVEETEASVNVLSKVKQ